MPKERNFNPVQAQRKAEKAKAIKKGKAEVVAARNERLAKKNPERIRKQIQDLKAITEGGGKLTHHEEQVLEGLEKELKAVTKARDTLGDRAPAFRGSNGGQHDRWSRDGGGFNRKRRHDDARDNSSDGDSDTPEDVRRIPMPRDTPPPIPKAILDAWFTRRRARQHAQQAQNGGNGGNGSGADRTGANTEPVRSGGRGAGMAVATDKGPAPPENQSPPLAPPEKPQSKAVYEAKPVLRDLQKEAVSAFMPTVVRRKLERSRGKGGLLDPEEADQLEREGYLRSTATDSMASSAGADHGGEDKDGGAETRTTPLHQLQDQAGPTDVPGRRQAMLEDADDEDHDEDDG